MKLIRVMILVGMYVSASVRLHAQTPLQGYPHVSVLSTKHDVFYFKVDPAFMGATVQVLDSTGTVFFNMELHSKRNLIDFFYLESGLYTIRFEQGDVVEEFQVVFDKKNALAKHPHISFFKLHA
jgi:hypothetical protein